MQVRFQVQYPLMVYRYKFAECIVRLPLLVSSYLQKKLVTKVWQDIVSKFINKYRSGRTTAVLITKLTLFNANSFLVKKGIQFANLLISSSKLFFMNLHEYQAKEVLKNLMSPFRKG